MKINVGLHLKNASKLQVKAVKSCFIFHHDTYYLITLFEQVATGYIQSKMTYNTLITLPGIIVNDQLT